MDIFRKTYSHKILAGNKFELEFKAIYCYEYNLNLKNLLYDN